MADTRRKNTNWTLPTSGFDWDHAKMAMLMDIRDELQTLNRLANCYRIPRALDAMYEIGKDIRRKKRLAAKRLKAKKASRA